MHSSHRGRPRLFWRRKNDLGSSAAAYAAFDKAKQAIRYAAFMRIALQNTHDEKYRQNLANVFHVCRSHAILTGAAIGHSATHIDEIIGKLCDEDSAYLKNASDQQITNFAQEAGEFVKAFLAVTGH